MTCPFNKDKTVLSKVAILYYPKGSRISLSRLKEGKTLCVSYVKETIAKIRNIQLDSLELFGVFVGCLGNPGVLLREKIPEDVIEVSLLRVSFDPIKEARITERDSSARHMIFCELKHLYECEFLLPKPGRISKDKITELICNASGDMESEIIQIITNNFFTYTSRNHLVTCQRNVALKPFSLSEGVVPIRIALCPQALIFFDPSGEEILMYWPLDTIICMRHSKSCTKLMALYILVDQITYKVLRPIIVQTSCIDYIRTLVSYIERFRHQQHYTKLTFLDKASYPYYLQKVSRSDLQVGVNDVENYLELIAHEMSWCIHYDKWKASNETLIRDCLVRKPNYVYVPRTGCEFEVIKGISIRTITVVNETESVTLKLQLVVGYEEKTDVADILQALSRYYDLADSISPDEAFQIYFYSQNGVIQELTKECLVSEAKRKFYFKAKPCKPRQADIPAIPSEVPPSTQIMTVIDKVFNKRIKPGFRGHHSYPMAGEAAELPHPLTKSYTAPPEGSQAPSNTPDSCCSTPPGGSPVKGARNSEPGSPGSSRHRLLQNVATRLSSLAVSPQDEAKNEM